MPSARDLHKINQNITSKNLASAVRNNFALISLKSFQLKNCCASICLIRLIRLWLFTSSCATQIKRFYTAHNTTVITLSSEHVNNLILHNGEDCCYSRCCSDCC